MNARKLHSEPLLWLLRGAAAPLNAIRCRSPPLPLAIAEIGCAWRDAALLALQTADRACRIAYSSDTSMGQVAALRADLALAALPRSLANHELVEVTPDYGLPTLPKTHAYLADDGSDPAKAFVSVSDSKSQTGANWPNFPLICVATRLKCAAFRHSMRLVSEKFSSICPQPGVLNQTLNGGTRFQRG